MKLAATLFLCDTRKCNNRFVSSTDNHTESYLDLVGAKWYVARLYNGWKHYCPDHVITQDKDND
jgi:hypothetical protein